MQEEKEHLMRNEGKHPANKSYSDRYPDHFGGDHGIDQNEHGVDLI